MASSVFFFSAECSGGTAVACHLDACYISLWKPRVGYSAGEPDYFVGVAFLRFSGRNLCSDLLPQRRTSAKKVKVWEDEPDLQEPEYWMTDEPEKKI